MLAIVVRPGVVLAKPDGLPTIDEVREHFVVVEQVEFNGFAVIEAATGTPPDDWRWVSTIELQRGLESSVAKAVGEALLCA